ncbi:MAG: hypothetical protein ACYCTH_12875 [Cellulomonas sp.]
MTFLVIIGMAVFIWLWYYIPRLINRGASKVIYKNTNANALDEIHTVLTFTAPMEPVALQRVVDEGLGLPHDVAPILGRVHVGESRPGALRVTLGSKINTEWSALALFRLDASGGTTGTYQVTNWTLRDGVVKSKELTAGMARIREKIGDAITRHGGSIEHHVVPVGERK